MSHAHVAPATDPHVLRELRTETGRFLSDPAARIDPVSLYGRLVREAPVLELGPMWLVSGFDQLTRLVGRPELRSFPIVRGQLLPITMVPSLASSLALMLPMRDGADHRRLRGLATTAFSSRRIADMESLIEETVDLVLGRAMAGGEMDFVRDVALPLPVAISTAMLNIPAGERSQVYEWAMLVRQQLFRYGQTFDEIDLVERQLQAFATFVGSLCDVRRRRPGDDLISDLISAADAGRLSNDELVAFVLMLFVNGLDTLTAGLTMATWELLNHPEDQGAVARDRTYAKAVFEEALRLHSPVRFSARTLVANVFFDGHRLKEGDVVALCYAAANRDPRRFADPDRFNPMRERDRHLGFGHGAHYCLGAPLSLATGAIVLQHLARPGTRLTTHITPETLPWSPSVAYTTLESLPVRIDPSTDTAA